MKGFAIGMRRGCSGCCVHSARSALGEPIGGMDCMCYSSEAVLSCNSAGNAGEKLVGSWNAGIVLEGPGPADLGTHR